MSKALTKERIANMAREVEQLSKYAQRCVFNAVDAERNGKIDEALALFDKQAKAEKRIGELLAIPAVAAALPVPS